MRIFHVTVIAAALVQGLLLGEFVRSTGFTPGKKTKAKEFSPLLSYNDKMKGREMVYNYDATDSTKIVTPQKDQSASEVSRTLSETTPEAASKVHIYTLPGIIGKKDNTWLGSDNLYNLPNKLGLVVDLVKPEGKEIPVNIEEIKKLFQRTLEKYGVKIQTGQLSSEKPLPFLHLLVMVLPVERNNYVVSADGRLFEEILNTRVNLEKGIYWQAITWEKEDLFFVPKDKLNEQIEHSFIGIANSFGERFKFFTDLKNTKKDR